MATRLPNEYVAFRKILLQVYIVPQSNLYIRTASARAIAFGFFTYRFQGGKLIKATPATFSMRKSAFLRAMSEQINTVRSRIQTGLGFFCNSDVKKIPNAIPLRRRQ
jgi:hypothetical protein